MSNIVAAILVMIICYNAYSQGDTLNINLKNGLSEKIAVKDIRSIKFDNINTIEENINTETTAKNFPNPFTEGTTIEFETETFGTVEVLIYGFNGILIRKLDCESCPAGKNQLIWDTKNQKGEPVSAGVYYYEIRANNKAIAKQMIKVK